MTKLPKDFSLEYQWELFLSRVGIPKESIPEDQRREMKRSFFGACGQLLILFREELNEYADKHGEIAAANVLQNMTDQVSDYWQKEMDKHSGKAN